MANLYGYNTSSARKLNEIDHYYGQNDRRELQNKGKAPQQRRVQRTSQKHQRGIGGLVCIAMLFVMAFSVVWGYVAINEANNEISGLKAEYNNIVASNQALQVKIDKAINLKELQTLAGEKFGMVRPERYQMFYVDLEMNDFSENTLDKKKIEKQNKVAIMGAPGIITGALNIFQ